MFRYEEEIPLLMLNLIVRVQAVVKKEYIDKQTWLVLREDTIFLRRELLRLFQLKVSMTIKLQAINVCGFCNNLTSCRFLQEKRVNEIKGIGNSVCKWYPKTGNNLIEWIYGHISSLFFVKYQCSKMIAVSFYQAH